MSHQSDKSERKKTLIFKYFLSEMEYWWNKFINKVHLNSKFNLVKLHFDFHHGMYNGEYLVICIYLIKNL